LPSGSPGVELFEALVEDYPRSLSVRLFGADFLLAASEASREAGKIDDAIRRLEEADAHASVIEQRRPDVREHVQAALAELRGEPASADDD
jgi:hypothetical protein